MALLWVLVWDHLTAAFRCRGDLPVEFPPLLLGPPQLLGSGGEIEEVNGHDRCPWTKVRVADQSVELTTSLDQASVDLTQPFVLFGGVAGPAGVQVGLLSN